MPKNVFEIGEKRTLRDIFSVMVIFQIFHSEQVMDW